MEEKRVNRFTTKIGPREFTITGHKSHRHMQEVSDQINKDLDDLGEKAPHLGLEERALLLSINAVSDLLDQTAVAQEATKMVEKADKEVDRIQERLYDLEALVDELIHDRDAYREQTERLFNENSQLIQRLTAADQQPEPKRPKANGGNEKANSSGNQTDGNKPKGTAEIQAVSKTNPLSDKKQQLTESPKRLSGLSKTPRF